jgi:hypothetical protein
MAEKETLSENWDPGNLWMAQGVGHRLNEDNPQCKNDGTEHELQKQGEDNITPKTWKGRTKNNKHLKNTKFKSGIRDRGLKRQGGNKGTSHKTATAS